MTINKYINMIGVEIECGVKRGYREIENFDIEDDGSIRSERGIAKEFVSIPFRDMKTLTESISELKKQIVELNNSMGFHVHISLNKPDYYTYLMSNRFFNYFVVELREYARTHIDGKLLQRFNNSFCKTDGFSGNVIDHQVVAEDKIGYRYYAVNYCRTLHGTIEFRVFPASKKMVTYVKLLVKIVTKFLSDKKNYLETINEKVDLEQQEIEERFIETKDKILLKKEVEINV